MVVVSFVCGDNVIMCASGRWWTLPVVFSRSLPGGPPEARSEAPFLLVGEAPGYLGARVSGIPFTSERQLVRTGPAEASATVVHRVLAELELDDRVLLWNVVPTHPGTETSNRRPTRAEIEAGRCFAEELARGRRIIAVGRIAQATLGGAYVRHPSHGGAVEFARSLRAVIGA